MQQTIGAEVYGHLKDSSRYQVGVFTMICCADDGSVHPKLRHVLMPSATQATTLVGNWNEERELRRSIMRDMLVKKETGSLRLDA